MRCSNSSKSARCSPMANVPIASKMAWAFVLINGNRNRSPIFRSSDSLSQSTRRPAQLFFTFHAMSSKSRL